MKALDFKMAIRLTLLLCTLHTYGATTANIHIQATVAQGSCTPSLDNGGLLQFGDFPVSHLYVDTPSGLDTRGINMHIACTSPTVVAFTFQDERSNTLDGGSADIDNYGFGIGQTYGGVNIGHFYLYVADSNTPVVNDSPARIIYSEDAGSEWQLASSSTRASNTGRNIMAFSDMNDFTHPLAVETASALLSIHPVVQSLNNLALTEDQPYEGLATLSLIYL